MTKNLSSWLGAGLIVASLLTSLGAASSAPTAQQAEEKRPLGGELGTARASAAAVRNPYEGMPQAVQAGRKLYRRHCATCHGEDARGDGKKAPDLHSKVVQDAAPGTLFWILRNGDLKEGMPSWSRLPDQRLWQIVTYLRTLREAEPQPASPAP